MERPIPTRCPLCDGRVHVERVRCEQCEAAVESWFTLDWVGRLSKEQLGFVKVFVLCRGKIKDVEQALGISYPTVVARLDEVVAAVGASAEPPSRPAVPPSAPPARPAATPGLPPKARLDVLEALATGAIDVDEAERRLKGR